MLASEHKQHTVRRQRHPQPVNERKSMATTPTPSHTPQSAALPRYQSFVPVVRAESLKVSTFFAEEQLAFRVAGVKWFVTLMNHSQPILNYVYAALQCRKAVLYSMLQQGQTGRLRISRRYTRLDQNPDAGGKYHAA